MVRAVINIMSSKLCVSQWYHSSTFDYILLSLLMSAKCISHQGYLIEICAIFYGRFKPEDALEDKNYPNNMAVRCMILPTRQCCRGRLAPSCNFMVKLHRNWWLCFLFSYIGMWSPSYEFGCCGRSLYTYVCLIVPTKIWNFLIIEES